MLAQIEHRRTRVAVGARLGHILCGLHGADAAPTTISTLLASDHAVTCASREVTWATLLFDQLDADGDESLTLDEQAAAGLDVSACPTQSSRRRLTRCSANAARFPRERLHDDDRVDARRAFGGDPTNAAIRR